MCVWGGASVLQCMSAVLDKTVGFYLNMYIMYAYSRVSFSIKRAGKVVFIKYSRRHVFTLLLL